MTPEFKAKFAELCEAEPIKFGYGMFGRVIGFYFPVKDGKMFVAEQDNDRETLWFLHKLAEALGGVVWVDAMRSISNGNIVAWRGEWDNGETCCGKYMVNVEDGDHIRAQILADESAVIGLMEWYLNNKKEK